MVFWSYLQKLWSMVDTLYSTHYISVYTLFLIHLECEPFHEQCDVVFYFEVGTIKPNSNVYQFDFVPLCVILLKIWDQKQ